MKTTCRFILVVVALAIFKLSAVVAQAQDYTCTCRKGTTPTPVLNFKQK